MPFQLAVGDIAARAVLADQPVKFAAIELLPTTGPNQHTLGVIRAVIDRTLLGAMASTAIARADLARPTATSAPRSIATAQVIEHGLRHLAWLARDDPAVAVALPGPWRTALDGYIPEPFRALG